MAGISYHQNVFDLLDCELPVSAEAVRMIEQSERRYGWRMPPAVREWYTLRGTVPLRHGNESSLWRAYRVEERPTALGELLAGFEEDLLSMSTGPWVALLQSPPGGGVWGMYLGGGPDPPIQRNTPRENLDCFSDFVFRWIAGVYLLRGEMWRACGRDGVPACAWTGLPMRHAAGFWLHSPREPALPPPLVDLLIELLDEPQRQERPGGVIRYTFTGRAARLQVTSDPWEWRGGHSAWWLWADSAEALHELAWRIWPIGTLRDSLRGFSPTGRGVLDRLRG